MKALLMMFLGSLFTSILHIEVVITIAFGVVTSCAFLLRGLYWALDEVATLLRLPAWFWEYILCRDQIRRILQNEGWHDGRPRFVSRWYRKAPPTGKVKP